MDRILIFFVSIFLVSAKIKINNLDVPASIEFGTTNDVVLDCDFESGNESVVEIKWFLDGLDKQIYQWLPETNKSGQAIGRLKDNIDVNYKATNDRKTMYRALHIVNLTKEFSGNYSCKVSGYMSEDVETKRMVIYETPDSGLDLDISVPASVITCIADGVYPEPEMILTITNEQTNNNETENVTFEQTDPLINIDEDTGLYNVTATLSYYPKLVTNTFIYTCQLIIPGTNYSLIGNRTITLEDSNESQIEEDYFNSLNATNSTESSFEGSQAFQESSDFSQKGYMIIYLCGQDNASVRHLAGVHLFFTILGLIVLL